MLCKEQNLMQGNTMAIDSIFPKTFHHICIAYLKKRKEIKKRRKVLF